MRHDAFELDRFGRHHRDELMMQLLRACFGRALVVALAALHQQREHLSEQLGGGPARERDVVRRIVVAGEQPPELALPQDRYRHRGRDAHVLEVFDVDRRYAAQDAHRQVEGVSLAVELRLDRGGRRIDVGNDAQPVALVENSRLLRDVGCRIMQPEIGFQARPRCFRDDFAGPVVIEAVDHDTVEAGDRAHLAGGDPVERAQLAGLLQPGDHAADHGAGIDCRVVDARLAFDNHRVADDMQRHVAAQSPGGEDDAEGAGDSIAHDRALQLSADGVDGLGGEDLVERPSQQVGRFDAEPFDDVARRPRHAPVRAGYREQETERLHRSDQVDRLPIAVGQVDGRAVVSLHRRSRLRRRGAQGRLAQAR